jgi:hypothetical protein
VIIKPFHRRVKAIHRKPCSDKRISHKLETRAQKCSYIILKTAVAGPKIAHLAKITAAFEFSVLTLTVPGLRAENFKILCAFNQLHHFGPP